MADDEIILEKRGSAGVVTLNRPAALNALTHGMVHELAAALDRWEKDDAVTRVVVKAAGEKAFCAGGDIRALYELGKAGRVEDALQFWRDEYRLNIQIKRYTKPYVALIDGMVMGGGVGVSLHGSHRVAGDRYRFAMPEVGIGFFPDVGATYALPRLPGSTGPYIALTGDRVGSDDAASLGLATHAVASDRFPDVLARLEAGEPVDATLDTLARMPGEGEIGRERGLIDTCFAADSVGEILERLDNAAGSDFARRCAAAIRTKSPTSLCLALEQMRRGRDLAFEAAMATEFRIVSRVMPGHEFAEGIRAAIIDKDGKPSWRPATLGEVSPDAIAAAFAPLGADELLAPAR